MSDEKDQKKPEVVIVGLGAECVAAALAKIRKRPGYPEMLKRLAQ